MHLGVWLKNQLWGRMDQDVYKENRAELYATNYKLLRTASLFSTGMCLFILALAMLNSLVLQLRTFYLVYTLLFAILAVLVLTVVKQRRRLIPWGYYIFATMIFILVIDVGTRWTPKLPAVTFYVFLMIIPILHVTRPIYSVLLSVGACVAFCAATAAVKGADSYLGQVDILNAICCCMVGIGVDVTIINLHLENIQSKSHFKRQSTTDELTGLPNRRWFDLLLERLLRQRTERGQDLHIIMIDIDDFKAYNDTYGHTQGDECLRRVGQTLEQAAKLGGAVLARYGGEELVAVVARDSGEEPWQIAERLVGCVAELRITHQGSASGHITVSVGHASLRETAAHTCVDLIACADRALYAAKASGKNQAKAWSK